GGRGAVTRPGSAGGSKPAPPIRSRAGSRAADGGTSLEKGLLLLQELATADRPLTIGELAEVAGLNRTTTYRLCDVLERAGWLQFAGDGSRSEEHTSELQSRGHLVCRLLLEKKKKAVHAEAKRVGVISAA